MKATLEVEFLASMSIQRQQLAQDVDYLSQAVHLVSESGTEVPKKVPRLGTGRCVLYIGVGCYIMEHIRLPHCQVVAVHRW